MLLQLSEEQRRELGAELCDLIASDEKARSEWNANRLVAQQLYFGTSMRYDTHWDGASDIHLPLVTEKVDMVLPRIKLALSQEIQVERLMQDFDPEETRLQQHYINWARQHEIPDFGNTETNWIKNILIDGLGVMKPYWRQRWRRTVQVQHLKTTAQPGERRNGYALNAPQPNTVPDFMDMLFGQGRWMNLQPLSDRKFRLTIVEDRRRIEGVEVEFAASDLVDEVEARVKRRILVQDCPSVDIVEAEDFIVPYRTQRVQTADRVTHRHYMTPDQIVGMADALRYPDDERWVLDDEDRQKLRDRKKAAGEQFEETDERRYVSEARDAISGVYRPDKVDRENARLQVYEVYLARDFDDDGEPEEVILQIVPLLRKIVFATYLDAVFPHGMRPFVVGRYTQSSSRFYVPGLALFLAAINIEVNTIVNQVNDAQELINNPIFFYNPIGFTVDAKVLEGLRPGQGVPVNDPNSVVFPQWNKAPLANLSAVDSMLMFADRMTVTPLTGGSTQMSNSPRTARGTIALLSESNVKLDMLVESIKEEGVKDLLRQLFGLYANFGSDEKYFWVTGRDKKRRPEMATRQHFAGQFDFILTGTTVNSNPEIRRMVAEKRYAVGSTNPLYGSDPTAFQNLLRDFFAHNDEGANVDLILPKLPGQSGQTHPPMTQESENQAMRLGVPVDVLPTDDDADHLSKMQAFIKTPEYAQLPPHVAAIFAHHGRAHATQLQQKMVAAQNQAQLQNGAGMANNVPTDLGDLEGGAA